MRLARDPRPQGGDDAVRQRVRRPRRQPRARDAAVGGVGGRLDRARRPSTPGARTRAIVVRDVATLRKLLPHGGLTALATGEAGVRRRPVAALEGIDETLLAITLGAGPRPAAAHLPLARSSRSSRWSSSRSPTWSPRASSTRGAKAGLVPGHRPGDGDPDRADVRRGHRLLPAAARALPRGAAADDAATPMATALRRTAPGDRLRGRDRRRGDARARPSPTTTRRAGWARCWRSASRSPCSPGVTLLPAILVRAAARAFRAERRTSARLAARSARSSARRPVALAAAVLAVLVAGRARQPQGPRCRSTSREQFRDPPESVARPAQPAGAVPARPGAAPVDLVMATATGVALGARSADPASSVDDDASASSPRPSRLTALVRVDARRRTRSPSSATDAIPGLREPPRGSGDGRHRAGRRPDRRGATTPRRRCTATRS